MPITLFILPFHVKDEQLFFPQRVESTFGDRPVPPGWHDNAFKVETPLCEHTLEMICLVTARACWKVSMFITLAGLKNGMQTNFNQ